MEMGPLFRLTPNLAEAITYEDCNKTYDAMTELGIDDPPYNIFTVCLEPKFLSRYITLHHDSGGPYPEGRVSGKEFGILWEQLGYDLFITYNHLSKKFKKDDDQIMWTFGLRKVGDTKIDYSLNFQNPDQMLENLDAVAVFIREFLIVLLATQNSEKITVKNSKRAGSHNVRRDAEYFEYTTTIRIGKITQQYEGTGSSPGSKKRAHLRRGHIRRQHYGEGRSEVKKIFIPPVFVNADESWIKNERKEYKILMA